MIRKIWAVAFAISIVGCSTTGTVKNAQGSGVKKEYPYPVEIMFPLTAKAITGTGGKVEEENPTTHYITASYGMSAWSWGEKVGVFCAKSAKGTTVEVVSQANLKTNITAVKRAPQIFEYLDKNPPK